MKYILWLLIGLLIFTLPAKFGLINKGNSVLDIPGWVPVFIGVIELLTALLLSRKRFRLYGAYLSCCIFAGAIFAHIFFLGIWYKLVLFPLAVLGFILSLVLIRKIK